MGLDFSNYKAPNYDRQMVSTLREALIIFNGLFSARDGKEIEKNFNDNPNCLYHYEVKTQTGAICSHKIYWEEVKRAIDYINNGNHSTYKKAQLYKDLSGGISLYLSTDGNMLSSMVTIENGKTSKTPCMLDIDDDKNHVSYSIGDIRQYLIY